MFKFRLSYRRCSWQAPRNTHGISGTRDSDFPPLKVTPFSFLRARVTSREVSLQPLPAFFFPPWHSTVCPGDDDDDDDNEPSANFSIHFAEKTSALRQRWRRKRDAARENPRGCWGRKGSEKTARSALEIMRRLFASSITLPLSLFLSRRFSLSKPFRRFVSRSAKLCGQRRSHLVLASSTPFACTPRRVGTRAEVNANMLKICRDIIYSRERRKEE